MQGIINCGPMRIFFIAILLSISNIAFALTIPKGKFYFDNSLTQYSVVKFVYGSDSNAETYVASMKVGNNGYWEITFDHAIENMYRYTFADTSLPDGKIEDTFSNVKEHISKTLVENRTATTSQAILVGGVYTPATGDNWAQGSWKMLSGSTTNYSGTLPVMYITTENHTPITSTDTYINAQYWIDNLGNNDFYSIGSDTTQLSLQIRGRGNYTWTSFDKKPYRIKLAEKAPLLGLSKSKHFALLAHADDNLAFLRNTVGFELSRRLGLKYTPAQQPVEVVLNNDYIGLYFLTETIRVAKNRVNITEQPDNITHPDSISGGWLIEIDNYDEEQQLRITEKNGEIIRFTFQSPEILSNEQRTYLNNQVSAINNAIYNSDKNSTYWESLVDIDSLARFYIVQEIMDNAESFHGSCYLHKEIGNRKWIFGPVWDFGNSYHRSHQEFIYQNPPFGQTWIGEIAKFPRFQQKVVEIWESFKGNDYDGLDLFIDEFCEQIATAAQYNAIRWPNYGNYDISSIKNDFNNYLSNRIDWLVSKWGEGKSGITDTITNPNISIYSFSPGNITISSDEPILGLIIYDISGKIVLMTSPGTNIFNTNLQKGVYIISTKTTCSSHRSKIIIN